MISSHLEEVSDLSETQRMGSCGTNQLGPPPAMVHYNALNIPCAK